MRENNAYCFLLRMAFLLTFIHNGGILKVTRFKNGNIFLVTKVFQKGYNVQMSLCVSLT